MKDRCYNPKSTGYKHYGGRGILVCKRWLGRAGFYNFWIDMGTRPSKSLSIDRTNNNKGYSPSNCKWATRVEQTNNHRTNKFHHDPILSREPNSLAASMKRARMSFNLTQLQFADRVGVGVGSVRIIEGGCAPKHGWVVPKIKEWIEKQKGGR